MRKSTGPGLFALQEERGRHCGIVSGAVSWYNVFNRKRSGGAHPEGGSPPRPRRGRREGGSYETLLRTFLTLVLVGALAACGGTSAQTEPAQGAETRQTAPAAAAPSSDPAENPFGKGDAAPAETSEEAPAPTADPVPASVPVPTTEAPSAVGETPSPAEPEVSPEPSPEEAGSAVLVAYFSRAENIDFDPEVDAVTSASINGGTTTGNAYLLAQAAQSACGGDLFAIRTAAAYPAAYRDTTDQALEEQRTGSRPALSTSVSDMGQYETVVLVYPNWWGGLPMAVCTFLESYDFSGKTILPICTHEGSGLGATADAIAAACPGARVERGLAVRGRDAASSADAVAAYLAEAGLA